MVLHEISLFLFNSFLKPFPMTFKSTNYKVNMMLHQIGCRRLKMFSFVCGTLSHAKSLLHWSAIHFHVY